MEEIREQPRSVLKSAASFLSGTLLSRVGGLVRDVSMAFCFGTSPAIAAFLVAYRFANLLRRIFGEGVLLNGFVPLFESSRSSNPVEAARFFRDLTYSLSIVLMGVIAAIEIILGLWLWHGISEGNREIVVLSMIMLPGLFFVSLFGLFGGLLQCQKKFFLTGAAPLAFNVIWIAAIWLFYGKDSWTAVIGLSVAVIVAFIAQWLMTLPEAIKYFLSEVSWKEFFNFRLFSPEVKQMMGAVSLGVVGVSATQFNNALDFIFARAASLEGPAYLNYAIHLYQLPLALFGIGMASALLPTLSRTVKKGDWAHFNVLFEYVINKTCLFLLPCTFAIFSLGAVSVGLIYTHGHFAQEAAVSTTLCLWAYGLGLVPAGIAMILAAAFYAQKDFRTSTIATVISVLINIVLNAVCVFLLNLGAVSIALATSAASLWNAGFLFKRLVTSQKCQFSSEFKLEMLKILISSLIAGCLTMLWGHFITGEPSLQMVLNIGNPNFANGFWVQLWQFISGLVVFVLFFCLGIYAMRLSIFKKYY